MAGAQVELTLQGIETAMARLGRLASADLDDLAFDVGALLEASTRERIATEKTSPDGAAWAPWSDRHAGTRKASHSLLVQDNHLLTSLQNYTEAWTVRVGTNLVYGAIHQFGGEAGRGRKAKIPARPYLGLSEADREAVEALVLDRIEELVQ